MKFPQPKFRRGETGLTRNSPAATFSAAFEALYIRYKARKKYAACQVEKLALEEMINIGAQAT
ncbi:hypothetical protein DBV15_09555 [Temnothorax longispinosus]|uniref:Uncharacterized protein n=1 Tax=Temnothorax longispinosus TaxID=300112 RepID=A0A4S2L2E0_9HYME|nr:hypothetical protein DBV15_09555 [Temnothorax longispinosus]